MLRHDAASSLPKCARLWARGAYMLRHNAASSLPRCACLWARARACVFACTGMHEPDLECARAAQAGGCPPVMGPLTCGRHGDVDVLVVVEAEGLEGVKQEVAHVLVQVGGEDAAVKAVRHAAAVHGLPNEVSERAPGDVLVLRAWVHAQHPRGEGEAQVGTACAACEGHQACPQGCTRHTRGCAFSQRVGQKIVCVVGEGEQRASQDAIVVRACVGVRSARAQVRGLCIVVDKKRARREAQVRATHAPGLRELCGSMKAAAASASAPA